RLPPIARTPPRHRHEGAILTVTRRNTPQRSRSPNEAVFAIAINRPRHAVVTASAVGIGRCPLQDPKEMEMTTRTDDVEATLAGPAAESGFHRDASDSVAAQDRRAMIEQAMPVATALAARVHGGDGAALGPRELAAIGYLALVETAPGYAPGVQSFA